MCEIEGQTLAQGEFRIQADRASYDKSKEMFILEGDTRTPGEAVATHARRAIRRRSRPARFTTAGLTNQVKVEGIQYLEITPSDVEKPAASRSQRQPHAGAIR